MKKNIKSKLNKLMAESMQNQSIALDEIDGESTSLFNNLKATKLSNQSNKFEKLYKSLVPFLKDANLYDNLQKMIKENKYMAGYKTMFYVAVYLIGQEFGLSNSVNKNRFKTFMGEEKDHKIVRK